jgi:hypothetical protein
VSDLSAIAVPKASGRPTVVQGAYGQHGNLELVYPDPAEGLWVCWFNNDDTADTADAADDADDNDDDAAASSGVAPRAWSSGLRFADGETYTGASIVQATLGPDYLEVAASAAGGALERWTWSPDAGFRRRDVFTAEFAGRLTDPHIAETPDGFLACVRSGGSAWVWRGDASAYPRVAWSRAERYPLPPSASTWAAAAVDGRVRAAAVTASGVTVSDDLASGSWRDLSGAVPAHPSALAWVAGSRFHAAPPALLVAGSEGIAVIDPDGRSTTRLDDAASADAVAAAWSSTGEVRLEVVARHGDSLRHLRAVVAG